MSRTMNRALIVIAAAAIWSLATPGDWTSLSFAAGGGGNVQSDPAAVIASGGSIGKGLSDGAVVAEDVDLYTGAVSLSLPLISVSGRAGLDVAIGLRYNSHVQTSAWVPNFESQASWVGLGWSLSFGSIVADHKNTRIFTDDDYYLTAEDGRTSRLVPSTPASDTFYTEDFRFWRIVRLRGTYNGVQHVRGWSIYREDGTVYQYGDLTDNNYGHALASRNATHYRICWGDFSGLGTAFGAGYSGVDSVFEIQWDLERVRTLKTGGQCAKFVYEQESASLDKGVNDTTKFRYTRASYPREVHLPNGRKLVFTLESRTDYDPRFADEIHQERYQSKRLASVQAQDKNARVYQLISFAYTTQGTSPYDKLLLSSVQFCDSNSNCLAPHSFEYITATDTSSNYLALSQVTYPSGGNVKYLYADFADTGHVSYNESELSSSFSGLNGGGVLFVVPGNVVGAGDGNGHDMYPFAWNGYWQQLPTATNVGGSNTNDFSMNEVLMAYGDQDDGKVYARSNSGGLWDSTVIFEAAGFVPDTDWIWTETGRDYVVILLAKRSQDSVRIVVCKRDFSSGSSGWRADTLLKANWRPYDEITDYSQSFEEKTLVFSLQPDFFSMIMETESPNKNRCLAAQWTGADWSVSADTNGHQSHRRWAAGIGYMAAINCGVSNFDSWLYLHRWNRGGWVVDSVYVDDYKLWDPEGNQDYFIAGAERSSNRPYLFAVKFNGSAWDVQNLGLYRPGTGDRDPGCYGMNSDGIVIARTLSDGASYNERVVESWRWTGADWELHDTIWADSGASYRIDVCVGEEVVGIYRSATHEEDEIRLSSRNSDGTWSDPVLFDVHDKVREASAGLKYVAISDDLNESQGQVFWYDGAGWDSSQTDAVHYNPNQPSVFRSVSAVSLASGWSTVHMYKFQQQQRDQHFSGKAEYFPVITKVLLDGMHGTDGDTTRYEYQFGILDASSRAPRFSRVAVRGPYQTDDFTVTWFYNDLDSAQGDSLPNLDGNDGYLLDGRPYSVRIEKATSTGSGGCDRDSTNFSYTVAHPKPGTSFIHTARTISAMDCVIDTTVYRYGSLTSNNANGLPRAVLRHASKRDGVRAILIDSTVFAHEVSGGGQLRDSNVLALPWARIVAESIGTSAPIALSRSCSYCSTAVFGTPWEFFPLNGGAVYRGHDGVAADTFRTIKWSDSIRTLDGYNLTQSVDAYGTMTSVRMGYDSSLVVATAANCLQREWAVWDFEEASDGFIICGVPEFDDVNTALISVSDSVFTGLKSGRVTATSGSLTNGSTAAIWGTTTCGYSIVTDTFVFDGWVRYSGGANECYVQYTVDSAGTNRTGTVSHSGGGQWEHLYLMIPTVTNTRIASVGIVVDPPGSTTKSAYIDDFRVSPIRAQVSTKTFDPKTWQVLSESGPANVPDKYSYDAFGRLIATRDHQGSRLETREYYLSRDAHSGVFVDSDPNFVETIVYRADDDSTVSRTYSDGLGRPIQSRDWSMDSTSSVYVVTVSEYDAKGRLYRSWKPYYSGSPTFSLTATDSCKSYYDGSPGVNCNNYPYSEKLFHEDPLGRLYRYGSPDTPFNLSSGNTPETKFSSNTASEVPLYGAGELRKSRVLDENDNLVTTYTDKLGRTIRVTRDSAALAITNSSIYDGLGRVVSSTDPKSFTSQFSYNALGQRTWEKVPDAGGHWMLYDRLGRLRLDMDSALAAQGKFVYFKYDELGRRTEWGYVSNTAYFDKDSADIPTFPANPSNYTKQFVITYDNPNLGGNASARGKQVLVSDVGSSNYRKQGYDSFGRLKEEEVLIPGLSAKTLKYEYNRAGMLTKETYPDDSTVSFTFDRGGRVLTAKSNSYEVSKYWYWPNGQIRAINYRRLANPGTTVQYVDYKYNPRDWLVSINDSSTIGNGGSSNDRYALKIYYTNPDGTPGGGASNYNGNISSIKRWRQDYLVFSSSRSNSHQWFAYDKTNRMVLDSLFVSTGTSAPSFSSHERFTYDANSNILTRVQSGTTMSYCYASNSNRVYWAGVGSCGSDMYKYDSSGNMTQRNTFMNTVDWRNLYIKVIAPHGPTTPDTITLVYDPLRQRVKLADKYWYCTDDCEPTFMSANETGGDNSKSSGKQVDQLQLKKVDDQVHSIAADEGGGADCLTPGWCKKWITSELYFLFDQYGRVVAEYEGSTLKRKYHYGPEGRFAQRQVGGAAELFYYMPDHVASTRVLVQGSNDHLNGLYSIMAIQDYEPYGKTISSNLSVHPQHLFGGHRWHAESELNIYYMGSRFYDPILMRFISTDPAGQYFSPYIYGGGNPIIGADPNGEWFFTALLIANLAYGGYRGYEAEGIGGAFKGITNAGIASALGAAGSNIAFKAVFNASVGHTAAGVADPSTFTALEDVAASVVGGAGGGAAGAVAGEFLTTGDVSLTGVLEGAAIGGGLGLAASDPVKNLLRGDGFKTAWQRFDAQGKQFVEQEVGFEGAYGKEGFDPLGDNPSEYDCLKFCRDAEGAAMWSSDPDIKAGWRQYTPTHGDILLGSSRGIGYTVGKSGGYPISTQPDFLIRSGRFLAPQVLKLYPSFKGFQYNRTNPWGTTLWR